MASRIEGFTKLNDNTSLYRPAESEKRTTSSGPCLIVYCSWMGAAPKHISKYTEGFKHVFSNAAILLIESTLPNMFTGADLTLACKVLESYSNNNPNGQIILQACSNGGANNATYLAVSYLKTHSRLPFTSLILDCCPGKGEAQSASEAMSMSLPKQPIARMLGYWIIYSISVVLMSLYIACGWEDTISRLRRRFNDSNVFHLGMPRLYLYSKNDKLVRWEHVREHACEAKRKGYQVTEEGFKNAAHAALLMEDNERYWAAVRELVLGKEEEKS